MRNSQHKFASQKKDKKKRNYSPVNVKVAAVIAADLNSEFLHDSLVIEVGRNPAKSRVAEVARIFTLATNVVNVLTGLLVWSNHSVVAVDGSWNTGPDTFAIVAVLDQALATWESIIHSLTLRLVKNSRPWSVTASLWSVVLILSKWVGQTVSNENGLEVDIALLVGKNL